MLNNFKNLIHNNDDKIERFLVRLSPARNVTSQMILIDDFLYKINIEGLKFNKIEKNGIPLDSVENPMNDMEFNYDEEADELTIFSFSEPGSDNVFILSHYLFFTDKQVEYYSSDPLTSIDLVEWQPRIIGRPNFSQSIENLLEGILSISSKTLSLKNQDCFFQNYLVIDTFYKKEIVFWKISNGTDTPIKKIFEGVCTGIKISNESCFIEIEDFLSKLADKATMGTRLDFLYPKNSLAWGIPPNFKDSILPLLVGEISRYSLMNASLATLPSARVIDPSSLEEAICTSYNEVLNGLNNRIWALGLSLSPLPPLSNGHGPISVDNTAPEFTKVTIATISDDNFDLYATGNAAVFEKSTPSLHFIYVQILKVDYQNKILYLSKNTELNNSCTYQVRGYSSTLFLEKDGEHYQLFQDKDYVIFSYALNDLGDGGVKTMIHIILNNNIETALDIDPIDPTKDRIFFRVKTSKVSHGTFLMHALIAAGVKVNYESFNNANLDLPVNCNFSIPYYNESEIKPYNTYIQDLLRSTLGFLRLNSDFEVEYKLFKKPIPTIVIDENEIKESSATLEISYKDITSSIIAFNPHYSAEDIVTKSNYKNPSHTISNNGALYLNQKDNTDQFQHVLDDILPILPKIMAIRSKRRLNYIVSLQNLHEELNLGDEVTLEHPLAINESFDGIVVSIDEDQIIISEIPLED